METYINIAIPIILALFAGVGWLYKHEKERRLLVERQLSEKKYQVYIKFINLFFELYENQKFKKEMSEQRMIKSMIEIKKDLMIYGSDKVIKKFFEWEEFSGNGKVSLRPITDVIIEMRRDMGSPKTTITTTCFLKSLIKNKNEYENLRRSGVV